MRRLPYYLVLLAAAACDLNSTEPSTRNQANQLELRGEWTANITGTGITGTTRLSEYRAYYNAEISIKASPSRGYNWRIYPGTCASPGTTVFGNSTQAFPPITTDATGSASLTRLLAGALDSTAVYNVRIMTGTAITTTVACGELQRG